MSPRKKTPDVNAPLEAGGDGFGLLFRSHPIPMWIYDLETLAFLEVNHAAVEKYGYTRGEFLGLTIKDIRPTEDVPRLLENTGGTRPPLQYSGEWRHRLKSGALIDAEITSHTIEFNGRACALVMARDVTKEKRTKEAVQASEKRFRALIQNGLDNISLLAADGTLLWESPAVQSTLNYETDQFVGRNIFEIMHPDDLGWTGEAFQKVLQEPGSSRHESFRLRNSKGEWRWVEAIATNMLHEPHIEAVVINYRDVTERRRAEEARKEAEIHYRSLFEQMHDGIFIMSLDGRIVNANQRGADMLGYTIEELRELSIFEASMQPEASREVTRRTQACGGGAQRGGNPLSFVVRANARRHLHHEPGRAHHERQPARRRHAGIHHRGTANAYGFRGIRATGGKQGGARTAFERGTHPAV